MARTLELVTPITVVTQPEIKQELSEISITTIDDGGCVMAQTNIGTIVLWDETTTPTYTQIGVWTDPDVDSRLIEILNQQ